MHFITPSCSLFFFFRSPHLDARRRAGLDPVHVRRPRAALRPERPVSHEWQSPVSHDHGDVLPESAARREDALQGLPAQAVHGHVSIFLPAVKKERGQNNWEKKERRRSFSLSLSFCISCPARKIGSRSRLLHVGGRTQGIIVKTSKDFRSWKIHRERRKMIEKKPKKTKKKRREKQNKFISAQNNAHLILLVKGDLFF